MIIKRTLFNKTTPNILYLNTTFVDSHGQRTFVTAAFAINFLIPLISIITYHRRVKLKLHEAASLATVQLSSNRAGTYSRATLMLNLIASAFFLSWSFYWIWNLSAVFIPGDIDDFIYYISMIGTTSSYGHSAFSPIIYMCCSDNFKQRFMDIISGSYPCCLDSNFSRSKGLVSRRSKSVLSNKTQSMVVAADESKTVELKKAKPSSTTATTTTTTTTTKNNTTFTAATTATTTIKQALEIRSIQETMLKPCNIDIGIDQQQVSGAQNRENGIALGEESISRFYINFDEKLQDATCEKHHSRHGKDLCDEV